MKTIAVLLVLLLATAACGLGRTPQSAPEVRENKTPIQLITEARQRGEIDEDTAVLDRVYAVMDWDKLPPRFRGTLPIKDGTLILRDARARFDSLRPETREALRPYLFPRGKP